MSNALTVVGLASVLGACFLWDMRIGMAVTGAVAIWAAVRLEATKEGDK